MTTQEKNFADEYVFLHFNGNEVKKWNTAISAARKAGYAIPADYNQSENLARTLLGKAEIKEYIESKLADFRAKLESSQRRNLWKAIADMAIGEPTDEFAVGMPISLY